MMVTGWRGDRTPVGVIAPGSPGGGGNIPSQPADPAPGLTGCGGPGPGALIGLR